MVSEIGEQWSPCTAPASTAPSSNAAAELSAAKPDSAANGTNMPIAPQEAPVANARNADNTKKSAGNTHCGNDAAESDRERKRPVPNASSHTPDIVQARHNITIAGTIVFMPSTIMFEKSFNPMSRRGTNRKNENNIAPNDANANEDPTSASANAWENPTLSPKYPPI